jgi:sigma-B regulation protein RsbU (phosphoserine phosphatase)
MLPASADTRVPRALLAVLFVVAAAYQGRYTLECVRALLDPTPVSRQPFDVRALPPAVRSLEPEAEQAGLRLDDVVVAVGGEPWHGLSGLIRAVRSRPPGASLDVTVERPGAGEQRLAIPLAVRPPVASSGADVTTIVVVGLVTPLLCMLLGFTVAAIRPRDGRAWLLLLLMLSFGQLASVNEGSPLAWGAPVRPFAVLWRTILTQSWTIWLLLFGLHFPEPLPLERRHPRLKWLLLGPLAAFTVLAGLAVLAYSEGWTALAFIPEWRARFGLVPLLLTMVAVAASFTCLGVKVGTASSADARRRLLIVLWGMAAALTPLFFLVLYGIVTDSDVLNEGSPWLVVPVLTCLVLFPLSLAYVIVVHRALDVRVVVRQGLQYALARRGVVVLQVIVSAAVLLAAATLASDPGANRPVRIRTIALGLMFVVLVRRGAQKLHAFLDRRFFREAYDAERILGELGESVRTIVEQDVLLKTVAEQISSSLHVPRVAALLRENGHYAAAHLHGLSLEHPPRLPASSATLERLRETRQPLRVSLDDPEAFVNRHAEAAADRPVLEALGSELLLPLAVKDRLLGVLSLGIKRSEEPFSPSDTRLLQSVAGQTALALENSRLTATVARELALRARMNREIEIAREVQEGLFPQEYPPVAGLRYAGHCRPALGVGGDYYDFIEVPGGALGIAIGDISGKGIPAALLMASLQASLRAQAISGPTDLAALMTRLNQLIHASSPGNRYATFFYGQYDPTSRRLEYVNAGHNAPMVFRGGVSGEVLRIEAGGPVIGLLPVTSYEQRSIVLQPGDVFVSFTDGVSEAMNREDEEWGEERLIATVRQCDGLDMRGLVARIMAGADGFADGAKQHDDMTLVVARAE